MEGERASENSICLSSYSLCFGYCFEISSPATWVFDSFFGSLVNTAFSSLLHAQLLAQPSWKTKVASFVGDGAGKTALGSEQPRSWVPAENKPKDLPSWTISSLGTMPQVRLFGVPNLKKAIDSLPKRMHINRGI